MIWPKLLKTRLYTGIFTMIIDNQRDDDSAITTRRNTFGDDDVIYIVLENR
jgi:hypothetical protein